MPDTERLKFLDSKHVIYEKWVRRWKKNERRLRGGDSVLTELHAFDWEVAEGKKNYEIRQDEAPYLNFGDMFLTTMTGHLLREAPVFDKDLSFGTLGKVTRAEGQKEPSVAELIAFNVDNAGSDGREWNNFWFGAWRRAGATGHRWMYVEAPRVAAQTEADQVRGGLRAWVVEWSPVRGPNWDEDELGLRWLIIRTRSRKVSVGEDGTLKDDARDGYLFLVRQGVQDFGTEFAGGGWFEFDADKVAGAKGDWTATGGQIPVAPLFYRRDTGSDSDVLEEREPAMSAPGITELGQCSISYMNLASAADFDAWDDGQSLRFFLGVSNEAFKLAMEKRQEGSRNIPVPSSQGGIGGSALMPVIQEGSGGKAFEVFVATLARKLKEAEWIAIREATSMPDSSGISKEMGFIEGKSPLLALAASELEQCQNAILRWLEMRTNVGTLPTAVVHWTRTFDLTDTVESIRDVFSLEKLIGISSPTLAAIGMIKAVEEKGLVSDDKTKETIKQEYQSAAQVKQQNDQQIKNQAKDFGFGG